MNSKYIKLFSSAIELSAMTLLITSSFSRNSIISSFFENIEFLSKRFYDTELLAFVILIMFIFASILKYIVYEVNKEVPKLTSKYRKLSIDISLFVISIVALLASIHLYSKLLMIVCFGYYITLSIIENFISSKYSYNKDIKKDKIL